MEIPKSVFIHPSALVETNDIGERTRIWAFAHVYKDTHIGADCNVCDYVSIESGVYIGDRATLKQGCSIGMGVHVEDEAFIGPGAYLPNDRTPRSPRMLGAPDIRDRYSSTENWLLKTRVCRGASIGTRVVLSPGITIGKYAMVGSGSVVRKDVKPFQLVFGMPARAAGWVCLCGITMEPRHDDKWLCKTCSREYVKAESGGLTQVR